MLGIRSLRTSPENEVSGFDQLGHERMAGQMYRKQPSSGTKGGRHSSVQNSRCTVAIDENRYGTCRAEHEYEKAFAQGHKQFVKAERHMCAHQRGPEHQTERDRKSTRLNS